MSHKSDNLYIQLLHGRDDPNQDMDEKGFTGPLIGPVGLSWVYGTLELVQPGWNMSSPLPLEPTHSDLVAYLGKFYGDWEIFVPGDPKLTDQRMREAHDYETFVRNCSAK